MNNSKSIEHICEEMLRRDSVLCIEHRTIQANLAVVKQLESFMEDSAISEYTSSVGNAFMDWIKSFSKDVKTAHYSVIISRINECLTESPWYFYRRLPSSYQISTPIIKESSVAILTKMQELNVCYSTQCYTKTCYNKLDLFMRENNIVDYSPIIGDEFLDLIQKHITCTNFSYFYVVPIKRLNEYTTHNICSTIIKIDSGFFNNWLSNKTDELLELLKSLNYSKESLCVAKSQLKRLDRYMHEKGINDYTEDVGNEFVEYSLNYRKKPSNRLSNARAVICHLNDLIQNKGFIRYHHFYTLEIPEQYKNVFESYIAFCKEEGNSSKTISHKKSDCHFFLTTLIEVYNCFSLNDLTYDIVVNCCDSLKNKWGTIRTFLRFCSENAFTEKDYSICVPHKKKKHVIPALYTKEEMLKLEAAPDRNTTSGKRDYAIVLLINRLGLRSSDVANLRIGSISFEEKVIQFTTLKTDVFQVLPLTEELANALNDYILNGRPQSDADYLFLISYAPYLPISPIAIHGIYSKYLSKAEIDYSNRKHGGHAFRASLSSAMINNGLTYDEVRKVLGHTDADAISHYARLDIEKLRLAALSPHESTGNFKKLLLGEATL